MKIRRHSDDDAFSLAIRWRTNWVCENCMRPFPINAPNLHCSHLFSRRSYATRFEPMNAFAHCFVCHRRFGDNPVRFTRWAEKKLGVEIVEWLDERHSTVVKRVKKDQPLVAAHFRNEALRMADWWADGRVFDGTNRPALLAFRSAID